MLKLKDELPKITIVLLSFIIGIVLSMQLKLNSMAGVSFSTTGNHLQVELTSIRERKLKAEKDIAELEEKIKLLRDSQTQSDEYYNSIKREIDNYELQSGLIKATGKGIVIDFSGNEELDKEKLLINFELLLSVINKLNSAGAEGIALNEERIIFLSDMRYEQGELLVNGNKVGKNIQIRAIGNPDILEATMNMRYGILWEMKNNFGISAKIEKKEDIELPRYSKEIKFKFAEIEE